MTDQTPLSIVIPCHNEREGLPGVVERLGEVMGRLDRSCEIVVVDDGSTDGSADRVDRSLARLVRLPQRRGYGAALKAGVAAARHELIAIIDADGTYPPGSLPDLLEAMGEADMIVGARTGALSAIPPERRPPKWLLGKLANFLCNRRIPDLNSGMRVIRRSLWEKYESYFPDGFSLTTTITLAALTNGHPVLYREIPYHPRLGASKIRPVHDTVEFFKLVARTVLYFDPLKIFAPVGLGLVAASVLVGIVTIALGRFMDVTTVLLFVTGLQTLAIGMLADLIVRRTK